MRTTTLFAIVFLALASQAFGQKISPQVIASAGGSGTAGGVTVMWTVGELAVATLQTGQGYLTQGFHQPPSELSSVPGEAVATASIDLWPNPAASTLLVRVGDDVSGIESVEIADMVGRPVLAQQGGAGIRQLQVDVSAVPSGSYLVRLKGKGLQQSRIVTIQK